MTAETTPLLGNNGTNRKRSFKGQMAILCLVRICEPISFLSVFAFVNQMIHELGVPAAEVGVKAGQIEGAFALAQFFTTFHWSRLSDKIGRRPVLMIGLSGVCISVTMFGLADSFLWMLVFRSAAGLLSGNVAIIKSILAEITDESNQARAFTMLPVCYALGTLIGPTIGGALARPVERYPNVFGGFTYLEKHPYALPCFVSAVFPFIGLVLTYTLLEETCPAKPKKSDKHKQASTCNHDETQSQSHDQQAIEDSGYIEQDFSVMKVLNGRFIMFLFSAAVLVGLANSLAVIIPLIGFHKPVNGGLGFDEQLTGFALTLRGLSTMCFQLFLFPVLSNAFGDIKTYRLATGAYTLVFLGFPLVTYVARKFEDSDDQEKYIWATLIPVLAMGSFGSISMVCTNLLTNRFAPSRTTLGATNGLVQSINALVRSIAPIGATALYSISLETSNFLGGHANFFWFVLFFIALIGFASSFLVIPPKITWRDRERQLEEQQRNNSA